MLVPVGQMRDAVLILTPVVGIDNSGGEVITYTVGDPIFVALRAVTTREGVQFGQMNADVTNIVFGHWGDLNALTANNRIRLYEDETIEFDMAGSPINSPKRDWTRLHLIRRENG